MQPPSTRPSNFVVPPLPAPDYIADSPASFFKLHKLRALRRKAKLKGVLVRTDPDMASAGIPLSPSSSKRSRSRDSTRSATSSYLNTPAANTPFVTPSVSTHSLIIPSSTPGTPANGELYVPDATPYPAFLRPSRSDLHTKWNRFEWTHMERLRDSAQAVASDQPNQWARCTGEEYALRNRYANVDPYQANRVQLDVPEGTFDYINASPIVLETTKSKTPLKYIATQVRPSF